MILLFLSFASAQPAPVPPPDHAALVEDVLSREQAILGAVRAVDPSAHDKLVGLRATDRPAYLVGLVKASRMMERARTDPAFALRQQQTKAKDAELQRLAAGFASLSAGEQAERRVDLERVAGELLDLRQAERRARLEELRVRLVELEAEIEEREKDRARIVDEYVDRLVEGRDAPG